MEKNFVDARILLKEEQDNKVLADTRIVDQDVTNDWIWIEADDFDITEGTKLSALIVTKAGFNEVLCMAQRKENNGTGLRLSIYKHLSDSDKRAESRYNVSAEGSLIVINGTETVLNRQIGIQITDISSNGIGFIINEKLTLNIKDTIEVFFVANGWSMRASGKVTYVFGPKIGARLSNIQKNHIVKDNNRFSKETKEKIDKAFEQLYICAHYVNLATDTFMEVNCMPHVRHLISTEKSAQKALHSIVDEVVDKEFSEAVAEFYDLDTLPKRLKQKPYISMEFRSIFMGVVRIVIVPVDYDDNGRLHGVLHVAVKIEEDLLKLRQNSMAVMPGSMPDPTGASDPFGGMTAGAGDQNTPPV